MIVIFRFRVVGCSLVRFGLVRFWVSRFNSCDYFFISVIGDFWIKVNMFCLVKVVYSYFWVFYY